MKILRMAIVGTGHRARAHLATIPKLTDLYQLVAVCDLNAERAKEVADQFKIPGYTDVEEMLRSEKPDVVLIAVGRDGHHTITKIATGYGVHCISETPIATTLAYADIMIDSAKKNGVKLEVSENVWRWPHERMKRIIVDSGLIGEVRFAKLWYSSGSYHGINAIRTLIQSEAKFVVGYTPKGPNAPTEIGIIEFENGASALYELPFRPRRSYWELDGTKGSIIGDEVIVNGEIYPIKTITEYLECNDPIVADNLECDDSIAAKDLECDDSIVTEDLECRDSIVANNVKHNEPLVVTGCQVETEPPLLWENPLAKYGLTDADDVARASVHYGMYKAIVEDTEPEYGAENARKDQEILIAIRESALKGSVPIELPLTEITEYERRMHEAYKVKFGHEPLETGIDEARSTPYLLRYTQ